MFGKGLKDILRRVHIAWMRNHNSAISDFSKIKRSLIVAPHPDDEVIGCGGLIARLVEEGNAPYILIMTGGEGSHNGCCHTPASEIIKARRGLTRNALSILGVPEENIHELNFPDGHISESNSQMVLLKELIETINPETILVPHWGEGWSDHVNTAQILKDIAPQKTSIWEYCVWMWYYNVWRGLDWKNASVLRMTPQEYELKLKAMDAYIKPLAPCGKPWSGVLPKVFIDANSGKSELYFKCR